VRDCPENRRKTRLAKVAASVFAALPAATLARLCRRTLGYGPIASTRSTNYWTVLSYQGLVPLGICPEKFEVLIAFDSQRCLELLLTAERPLGLSICRALPTCYEAAVKPSKQANYACGLAVTPLGVGRNICLPLHPWRATMEVTEAALLRSYTSRRDITYSASTILFPPPCSRLVADFCHALLAKL
jgi:hypothetical protein